MDLHSIKKFVKNNGDKFVIVEEGEPSLVVMSFQEYEKISSGSHLHGNPKRESLIGHPARTRRDYDDIVAASLETERLQRKQEEIGDWDERERAPRYLEEDSEHIRLEDLPL